MAIKVNETMMHKDQDGKNRLVCIGKLILIRHTSKSDDDEEEVEIINHDGSYKPIIISETELINPNDSFYNPRRNIVQIAEVEDDVLNGFLPITKKKAYLLSAGLFLGILE